MATVMRMHWPQATEQQYEQARAMVNWEAQVPEGARFHVAWFADNGMHVVDIWDSQAHFERFLRERLEPAIKKIGIQGEPYVEFAQAHAIFAPNISSDVQPSRRATRA